MIFSLRVCDWIYNNYLSAKSSSVFGIGPSNLEARAFLVISGPASCPPPRRPGPPSSAVLFIIWNSRSPIPHSFARSTARRWLGPVQLCSVGILRSSSPKRTPRRVRRNCSPRRTGMATREQLASSNATSRAGTSAQPAPPWPRMKRRGALATKAAACSGTRRRGEGWGESLALICYGNRDTDRNKAKAKADHRQG